VAWSWRCEHGSQVAIQAVGVVVTILWSGGISYILLKAIDSFVGLRVSEEHEIQGLDITQHEERGYNL